MKRSKFHRAIVAIAMILIGWLPSLAADFEVGGLYCNILSSTQVEVTYKGSSSNEYSNEYTGSIVIPDRITYIDKVTDNEITYRVTRIGENAFRNCTSLTSIEIQNGVTSISGRAFMGCTSLTSIKIPNSVTDIFYCAFEGCSELKSITIPNGVTYIATKAFYGCKGLTSITIPKSVTKIGYEAFYGCKGLTSITIPESVTEIGYEAFGNCTKLTIVNFNAKNCSTGIEYSSYPVFKGCSNLSTINIGNKVETIPEGAFKGCTGLTSITIPNSVTSIGTAAFSDCTGLTEITIGNSVTYIGSSAFEDCIGLTYITIPDSVTYINTAAFKGCTGLTSVTIGNSVTYIGSSAFKGCTGLTSITIPESVTEIGYEAFGNCTKLTIVNFNAKNCPGIESSRYSVFEGCSNLSTINIGNKVETIPKGAFKGCTGLTSITIPNSVTSIGTAAFSDCTGLTEITIGNSVTYIGSSAFEDCTGLTYITIPDSVTYINTATFKGCTGLTSVTIGNSVTYIGSSAFKGCTGLTSITIPESVTEFDYEPAFSNCTKLTIVNFNAKNCPGIEYSICPVFKGCSNLSTINIGNKVETIPEGAFNGCTSIKTVNSYTKVPPTIYNYTFKDVNDNAILHVVKGCKNAYAGASYWKSFLNIIDDLLIISKSILLDKTNITTLAGETVVLTATIYPEDATEKDVVWSSSDEAVATVDENGLVTAIAVGEATITATTVDGSNLFASCKVTVVPTLAESIALDKTEISLEATETVTLVATVLPELTTNKSVTWTSSNESVATVDTNGLVTAIALGEAVITATTNDGSNLSASCKVSVPTLAESIVLDKTAISLKANESAMLVATVLPESTTDKSVMWTSLNESVATVDANGLVTAIAVGEAIITATTIDSSNLSATCKVTVMPTLAESITLDKTEISLEAMQTATLVATILPELATNKAATWTSSDKAVASVDENGLVTAIAVGEAIITATTNDGSNLSASCKVSVVPTLAESIVLDKTAISLKANESAMLVATVLPESTTDKSVMWTSLNESVATVDANGLVTAIAVGEAIITATTNDGSNLSASCKVTVIPTLVTSIEVTPTEYEGVEGSEFQLTAIILPKEATNKAVIWSSSDEVIASVSEDGLVKVLKEGNTVITASTTDGSNLTATCKITVLTGIDGVSDDNIIVVTSGDYIIVSNAPKNIDINVYSNNGTLIRSVKSAGETISINISSKGIYYVKVGNKTVKVII